MNDTFRKSYKELKTETTKKIQEMKVACEEVEKIMRTVNSREMSLALTNLEQAAMWATKAFVLEDTKNG